MKLPWSIYHDDPHWVPQLLAERLETIDPKKNPFFGHGEAALFLAERGGEVIGRISAHLNHLHNEYHKDKTGFFGFFECVNDEEAAAALFDHAATWACGRGLDALYGPYNLDYENGYGVLIEGRDRPPALLCGHTPAYYQGFFEGHGFRPAHGDNLAFAIDLELSTPAAHRLSRLAEGLEGPTLPGNRPVTIPGELLLPEASVQRGMLYGLSHRHAWMPLEQANPSPLWKWWDSFDIRNAEMLGY